MIDWGRGYLNLFLKKIKGVVLLFTTSRKRLAYCVEVRYLLFIYSWDSSSWQLLYSCDFNIFPYTCHIAFLYFQHSIIFIISYKLLLLIIIITIIMIMVITNNCIISISIIIVITPHARSTLIIFLIYFYFTVIISYFKSSHFYLNSCSSGHFLG